MPESRIRGPRWLAVPAALCLLAMAWAGWAAPALAVPGWLLAVLAGMKAPRAACRAPILRLLGLGLVASAVLLLWPLLWLASGGGVWAALAASAGFGFLLLACWRGWPLWRHALAGDLHDLRDWPRLIEIEPAAWRGLGLALAVAVAFALPLALAVPGLLPGPARWLAAGFAALLASLPAIFAMRRGPAIVVAAAPRAARNAEPVEVEALETLWDEPTAEAASPPAAVPDDAAKAVAPPAVPPEPAELYAAARHGRVEHALALLEAGADALAPPPADERDQRTLAQLAAVLPDLRLLRALIQRGVPLTAAPGQPTPLLAATRDSWHGRPEAVMTLLANGADVRARDGDGRTPLHHAARSTDPSVAALLLDAAAEIDALDDQRQSPLALACQAGNWRMAKFLVERGAHAHPAGGQPVLLAAAAPEEDDPAGVEFLLRQRAAPDARGEDGRTALHQAAAAGHLGILQTLLDAGADPALRDDDGHDAWLLAAGTGRQPLLEALLEAGADVQAVDARGRDALMLALVHGHAGPALANWLRERGIDTHRLDATGYSALEQAVAEGHWALAAAIDPDYPLPVTVREGDDEAARPPPRLLGDALAAGDETAVRQLAPLLSQAELDRALLDTAAANPAWVGLLRQLGATLDARDAQGDGVAFLLFDRIAEPAARHALETLLAAGAQPGGRGGLARLLTAALAARLTAAAGEALALDLLARGIDPFAPAAGGQSPLALAIRLGWPRLAGGLLARGADPNQTDARGLAPLHLAAALGQADTVRLLLRHGAQPALRAGDGQTALGVALASGQRELVGWLDWRVWPHPGRPLREEDLPAAATIGDLEGVKRLLALGFACDARDAQGCGALLRAAGGGHQPVVEHLLAAGAAPDLAAATGATPLSAAISRDHGEVVDILLAAGADVDARLSGGASMLMLAAALGQPQIVQRLLAAGARVEAGDQEGLLPMHCAALHAFGAADRARVVALFDTLLLAGADADAATPLGVTPLLLLLGARAEPGAACHETVLAAAFERLRDAGVSLAARDTRGFGPLHLAALHGLPDMVRRLLLAGADPEQRDQLNRGPREIALMRGFLDIAAEFPQPAAPGPGMSMARFLRDRRGD
ncbi:hypothetical protein EBB59_12130 [Lysobacter pythonis]|uniref:Uncharacterized protein n=1 Tax=Solilutibacter pythonis TaxID=2483112 RepID=A0A3M2HQT5_9GAMM|nr:ankyrin repeat domain-containing protein [Lysobacter pythonis]RMH88114.1 hypothetical protein EBB59_12130 [Lysobacter pythonis]